MSNLPGARRISRSARDPKKYGCIDSRKSSGEWTLFRAARSPSTVTWFVLVLVLVLAIACGDEPAPPEPVARPVKIIEFGGSGSGSALEYPGRVDPSTNAEVAFEVSGKLVEFPVNESQEVVRGDLIAKLDPRDYQSDLDAALALAAAERAEYGRMQVLFDNDVISKQELERSQRGFEVTSAGVKKAQKAVDDTMLRAPFDGVIARKIADDFANVKAKEPIVLLQSGGALQIVVNLPETDFATVQPGLTIAERNARLEAEVVLSALPDRSFPATLKEFATAADPTTRTFAVTFAFTAGKDVNVMPGMTARLIISGSSIQSETDSIPVQAATAGGDGNPYVWVVDKNSMKVHKTSVTLGELTGPDVEVKTGLKGGDLVVTSGVHQLREGMQVRRMSN